MTKRTPAIPLRHLPRLMRELCLSVSYHPKADSLTARDNLVLRVGSMPDDDWHELSAEAQDWYNRARKARIARQPLPGFSNAAREYNQKRKPKESIGRTMAREMVKNYDASWADFTDACLMAGVRWTKENFPRVQKSTFKSFLEVLDEEGCLNEKGKKILEGNLIRGNR